MQYGKNGVIDMEQVSGVAELVTRYGLETVGLIVLALGLYKLIKMILDEYRQEKKELREDLNNKTDEFIKTMNNVSKNITESNEVNKNLSETNRLYAERIDGDLKDISNNINIIKERLDRKD